MTVIDFEKFKKERRGGPTPPAPVPESDQAKNGRQRLVKALRELHEAALRQGAEVKQFCHAVSDLKSEIAHLEKSCVRLDHKIRRIHVRPLRRSAIRLNGIMGAYLAAERP